MSGFFLNLGLIVWVGILIPSLTQIPFGFNAFGDPNDPTTPSRLILLPLLSLLMFIGGVMQDYIFIAGRKTSALVHCVDLQRDLRVVVFDGGFVSGDDADLNNSAGRVVLRALRGTYRDPAGNLKMV